MTKHSHRQRFLVLLGFTIGLGICFRFLNLGEKLIWHDEVFTALRSGGWFSDRIYQTLFTNQIVAPEEVHQYLQLRPDSTMGDTLRSLAQEDPHHTPLYFLLTRWWMEIFGSDIGTLRSLAALISVLSLPLMFVLCQLLFADVVISSLATALMAIAPAEIGFAQITRQYSLQMFCTLLSSWLLWRSLRQPRWQHWVGYSLSAMLGLYSHLFFGLTLISHSLFLLGRVWWLRKSGWRDWWWGNVALLASAIAFIPWIIILQRNLNRALAVTDWAFNTDRNIIYLLKYWILNASYLFFDWNWFGFEPAQAYAGIDHPGTYWLRLPFLLLLGLSLWCVARTAPWETRLFLLISVFVPLLLLVVPDVVRMGQRSTIPRYFIACYPALWISVAYWLKRGWDTWQFSRWRWVYPVIACLLITGAVISNSVNGFGNIPSWTWEPSIRNGKVASYINDHQPAIVIGDRGWGYTNLGDMFSLSYLLDPQVTMVFLNYPPQRDFLEDFWQQHQETQTQIFLYRPTPELSNTINQLGDKVSDTDDEYELKQWVLRDSISQTLTLQEQGYLRAD